MCDIPIRHDALLRCGTKYSVHVLATSSECLFYLLPTPSHLSHVDCLSTHTVDMLNRQVPEVQKAIHTVCQASFLRFVELRVLDAAGTLLPAHVRQRMRFCR